MPCFRAVVPILVLALAACAAPRAVVLSDFDTERNMRLRVGQRLVVTLPADRSAGYGWALANDTLEALMVEGEPTFMRESGGGATTEVEGSETWRLVAVRKGRDMVRFEYRKLHMQEAPPERVARYTIVVD